MLGADHRVRLTFAARLRAASVGSTSAATIAGGTGAASERCAMTTAFLIQLGFALVTAASLALFLLDFEQLETMQRQQLRDRRLQLRVLARAFATLGAALGASSLGVYVGRGPWAYWPAVFLLVVAVVGGAFYVRSTRSTRVRIAPLEISEERSAQRAGDEEPAGSHQSVQSEQPRRLPKEKGSSEQHTPDDQPEPSTHEHPR
jgi:hypothetical protein